MPPIASQGGNSLARKAGQIIARLIAAGVMRAYSDCDHETNKRKCHIEQFEGSGGSAGIPDEERAPASLGRATGNEQTLRSIKYVDRWFETAVKPRVGEKSLSTRSECSAYLLQALS